MYFYTSNQQEQAPYPFRSELIFQSNIVWIGVFNCHHTYPYFSQKQHFEWHHMVVFPRTSVGLNMHGRDQIIGSPNLAIFYNSGTVYERKQLTDEGDRCDYFQFSKRLLLEILSTHDPTVLERDKQPFLFTHALISQQNFLRHRQLVELIHQPDVSPLQIDEMALVLLEGVVADSFIQRGIRPSVKKATLTAHRQLVIETQKLLLTHYHEHITLQNIAESLYVSPYHLSRIFRQQTGRPLHQYLENLRLRNAFERLGDYTNDLNRLALDVGYSNHSHFTAAFRKNFGFAPSQWKGQMERSVF